MTCITATVQVITYMPESLLIGTPPRLEMYTGQFVSNQAKILSGDLIALMFCLNVQWSKGMK